MLLLTDVSNIVKQNVIGSAHIACPCLMMLVREYKLSLSYFLSRGSLNFSLKK